MSPLSPSPSRPDRFPARRSIRLLRAFAAVAGIAASAPLPSRASPPDTSELPEARVRADRPRAAGTQVLTLEDIRRRDNLADALKSVPGFRIRRQAGLGGYSEAWFR